MGSVVVVEILILCCSFMISPLFVLDSDMLQFEFTSQFLHLYKAYLSPLSFYNRIADEVFKG